LTSIHWLSFDFTRKSHYNYTSALFFVCHVEIGCPKEFCPKDNSRWWSNNNYDEICLVVSSFAEQ